MTKPSLTTSRCLLPEDRWGIGPLATGRGIDLAIPSKNFTIGPWRDIKSSEARLPISRRTCTSRPRFYSAKVLSLGWTAGCPIWKAVVRGKRVERKSRTFIFVGFLLSQKAVFKFMTWKWSSWWLVLLVSERVPTKVFLSNLCDGFCDVPCQQNCELLCFVCMYHRECHSYYGAGESVEWNVIDYDSFTRNVHHPIILETMLTKPTHFSNQGCSNLRMYNSTYF